MRTFAIAFSAFVIVAPVHAEDTWTPNKPIKLIVTYAPGGSADVLARLMQDPMSKSLGVPIVIENRAGGGGNIGTAAVAHAEPDGYTIGIGAASTHAINPALFGAKLPFRVPDDFTPIGQILSQPNVLLVSLDTPVQTAAEFVGWMKANPGTSFGTAGVGSTNHLTGELINLRFGIKMTHTPYKSGGQALNDLIGNHVKIVIDNITTAAVVAKNNQARAIAVSTLKRAAILPDTPTFDQSGAPGFDLSSWQGLFGPRGLPTPVLQRLHAALVAALANPIVRTRLHEFGSEPVGSTPEQFLAYIKQELPKWGELVKISGATIN
jgi:tripartite-type tricarboxylate transporter receptor subunit TctC